MLTVSLKRWIIGLLPILAIAIFSIAPALQVSSQATTPGQGLEISPPLIEQNVDPGQNLTLSVRLRNITQDTLIVKTRVDDFAAEGEDGQPKLLLDDTQETSYGLKDWVGPVADLTLKAQEVREVEVPLNVPADASPGGHYGVIRFSGVPPDQRDTGLSLSASIGPLVLLTVSGDINEQAAVEEFSVSQDGQSGNQFSSGPLTISERIANIGNVHVKPIGVVKIKNLFGQEVASLPVNEAGGNVLPDSVRKFEQALAKTPLLGRYTADLELTYGDNQTLAATTTFWAVPYQWLAIALVGLIVLVVVLRFGLRSYKRSVISHNQP